MTIAVQPLSSPHLPWPHHVPAPPDVSDNNHGVPVVLEIEVWWVGGKRRGGVGLWGSRRTTVGAASSQVTALAVASSSAAPAAAASSPAASGRMDGDGAMLHRIYSS